MKVWVVIRDETDYNGDRTIFGVFPSEAAAQGAADWELEKAKDWAASMEVSHWIPNFYIEESTFFS